MSRSSEREPDVRVPEAQTASRIPPSQERLSGRDHATPRERLAAVIDRAAQGKPEMAEFISRLEKQGVAVLPSVQSSGKLNGLSYRFEGTTFNGSAIGRAYTASGIQSKRGVEFQPERDRSVIALAVERGGMRRDTAARSVDSRVRSRDTGLTESQQGTLAEIGKFRIVAAADLVTYRYDGNTGKFDRDLRPMVERGLAERRVVTHGRAQKKETVIVLTVAGRKLLRRAKGNSNDADAQQFYAGFVKPAEVPHDIGIYRMYQQEAARIEREGGTIRRVVLDFELKKRVYGELNRPVDSRLHSELAARKAQIAGANGLSVVEGRVVFPDLRIEYETRDQEMEKVDLELTTGHYKEGQLAAKRTAGLKLYSPDSSLGSPAHYDTEIVSGVMSL